MKSIKHLVMAPLLLATLSGCVSSGKYDNLEKKQTETQAQAENLKMQLVATQNKVNELNKKVGITENEKIQLEGSMAEMQTALDQLKKRKLETEKRLNEFKELTSKFSKLVSSGQLSVKMIQGRMTVALSTDILFGSGSSKLSTQGIKSLKEVAQLLKGLEGRKFQVEGHTDNLPMKSEIFPSNWELASARSISVVKTMLDAGLPANLISAASFADTMPIADNSTQEGKKLNRRIAIVIVPDLSDLPGNEEIEKMITTTAE